jgi:dipeptidase E
MVQLSNLLLSSRAFKTPAITQAFIKMLPAHHQSSKISIIVNSVKEGRLHPKMIALQTQLHALGFRNVTLFDVFQDNLDILKQSDALILNGGYEFYLLHALKSSNADQVINDLAQNNRPIYGISAGAIVLGPDLQLYQYLYPEDNLLQDKDLHGLKLTTTRIYPHFDQHAITNPGLIDQINHWENTHHQSVIRLNNDEGLLIQDENVKRL